MGRILYFDCLAGISGDMTLGALLDLGVDQEKFREALSTLHVDGFHVEILKRVKDGIHGTDVHVHLEGLDTPNHVHDREDEHTHIHPHDDMCTDNHIHDGDKHTHDYVQREDKCEHAHGGTDHAPHHHHVHRNLYDIQQIIEKSDITPRAKMLSKQIFKEVALAEAHVHGKPIEEIHFHEVGALDSIVDIIGAGICMDLLDVDEVYSSHIHLGTGFIECAHGIIPVPAPATIEILRDVPVYSTGIKSELVTPTGAAIIKTLTKSYGPMPEMVVEKVGYGMGDRALPIKGMLRVMLGKKKPITKLSC